MSTHHGKGMTYTTKSILIVMLLVLMASLAACGCEHEWVAAICNTAKTCSLCGDSEGEVLEHIWLEATCVEPQTCGLCGATDGETLEHAWHEATCTEPKTCELCGETEGEATGHAMHEEPMVVEATLEQLGERNYYCEVCNEVIRSEVMYYYDITDVEIELYNNVLNTINSLKAIHMNPDSLELLGATATTIGDHYRTTIYLSYIGGNGETYEDYFWKDTDDDGIKNIFGVDNYEGLASGGADSLDLEELEYYASCGAYVEELSPGSAISVS